MTSGGADIYVVRDKRRRLGQAGSEAHDFAGHEAGNKQRAVRRRRDALREERRPGKRQLARTRRRADPTPMAITNPAATSTTPRIRLMSRPSPLDRPSRYPDFEGRPCPRSERVSPDPAPPRDVLTLSGYGRRATVLAPSSLRGHRHDWRQRRRNARVRRLGHGCPSRPPPVVFCAVQVRQVRRFRRAATKESPRRPISSRSLLRRPGAFRRCRFRLLPAHSSASSSRSTTDDLGERGLIKRARLLRPSGAGVSGGPAERTCGRPKRARAAYGPSVRIRRKGAASMFAPLAPGDCSDSSDSAASGYAKRCPRTAPLPRTQASPPALLVVVRTQAPRRRRRDARIQAGASMWPGAESLGFVSVRAPIRRAFRRGVGLPW